jgi:hypothetical protein
VGREYPPQFHNEEEKLKERNYVTLHEEKHYVLTKNMSLRAA